MGKTVKEIVVDYLKSVPISFDKHKVPYVSMTNFIIAIRNLEKDNLKSAPQIPKFDTTFKNAGFYSHSITIETEKYANELYLKYQKKVDKFLTKKYKEILNKGDNGRNRKN